MDRAKKFLDTRSLAKTKIETVINVDTFWQQKINFLLRGAQFLHVTAAQSSLPRGETVVKGGSKTIFSDEICT